jgi:hypothetical protein
MMINKLSHVIRRSRMCLNKEKEENEGEYDEEDKKERRQKMRNITRLFFTFYYPYV